MNKPALPFQIGLIDKSDEAAQSFIYSTWLKSFRDKNISKEHPKLIHPHVYMINQHKVVERLLRDESVDVYAAINPDDESHIFGYLVASPTTLHYIYVRLKLQNFGIGRSLFNHWNNNLNDSYLYTHLTLSWERFNKGKGTYNPYLLYKGVL